MIGSNEINSDGKKYRARRLAALACLVALCALFVIVVFSGNAAARRHPSSSPLTRQQQQQQAQAAPTPLALTPQERRGRSIYLRGESPSGREIVAVLGELDVPASTLTCAGCHGARGEGKTEGGVTAGALAWTHLTKPYGHTHPTGRRHAAPFDDMALIRAVANGTDPAGNSLLVAMPRYRMSAEDMADLIAYLKRVEFDRDPGLSETTLTVGLLIPSKGALFEAGQSAKALTIAYFEELNRQGGIYNRRVELRFTETGDTAEATATNVERLIQNEQVFALVNVFNAAAEREVAAVVARHEVPVVGAFTLLPPSGSPPGRQIFYLLPGLDAQARALVNFAAERLADKRARFAIVHARGELTDAVARAFAEQSARAGWSAPAAQHAYERGKFDAASTAAELKRAGAQSVFFAGAGGDEMSLLKEAEKLGWFPHVFLPGATAGGELVNAPTGFKDKIFVAFPSVPTDITAEGMRDFRALAEKHALPARHVASQLSAYAGAHVLVEGLKRAGQDLTREKLIAALEGLYEFNTGLTPPLTFGPNRRVGAMGAHIIAVNVEKKEYVPVGGWVKADK